MSSSMRIFKAIVWVDDQAGERIAIEATSGREAYAQIRETYGPDAIITLWNDEDRERPRSRASDESA